MNLCMFSYVFCGERRLLQRVIFSTRGAQAIAESDIQYQRSAGYCSEWVKLYIMGGIC